MFLYFYKKNNKAKTINTPRYFVVVKWRGYIIMRIWMYMFCDWFPLLKTWSLWVSHEIVCMEVTIMCTTK